jgi:hypothetical protein
MTAHVTFKPKCYVFVCVGCGLLAESERSDAVTCSPACRVRAHRSGQLKRLREAADAMDITVALIQQSAAIKELAPDMDNELFSGRRRKIDLDVRKAVWAAFWERLQRAAGAMP